MERKEIINLINECENICSDEFKRIDNLEFTYSNKVLEAFQKNQVSEGCFNSTTGYGYNDLGRDTLESIYKDIFGSEDAIVRNQFISGSHALAKTFFALLRQNDLLTNLVNKYKELILNNLNIEVNIIIKRVSI